MNREGGGAAGVDGGMGMGELGLFACDAEANRDCEKRLGEECTTTTGRNK